MHLFGLIIRIYHDERSPERQISQPVSNSISQAGYFYFKSRDLNNLGHFVVIAVPIPNDMKDDKINISECHSGLKFHRLK